MKEKKRERLPEIAEKTGGATGRGEKKKTYENLYSARQQSILLQD